MHKANIISHSYVYNVNVCSGMPALMRSHLYDAQEIVSAGQ